MQAARGASLTSDATAPSPRRTRSRFTALFAGVALAAYLVDLLSKVLAVDRLAGRPDVHVVGDLLVLHLTRNPGAAFSTGTRYTVLLSCVAIVAVLVICYLSRRVGHVGWAVALGLLLAGVSGNLTDRLFRAPGPLRGHVVDFFMLPHWPIFNVADICIDVAAALILVLALRGIRMDGARAGSRDQAHDQTDDQTPETPQGER
jgi:signal peptidase II